MNIDDNLEPNSDELDIEAGLAEITSELFGQGEDGEAPVLSEGEDATDDLAPTEEAGAPPQTDAAREEGGDPESSVEGAVGDAAAPSTWSKAAAEKWAGVDPAIKAEVLKREQDMFNGLEQYKSRAEIGDRYESVIAEFKPVLEAEQVDPVELFGNFAANHYLLSRGTPEQKLSIATNLMAHYGIDIEAVQQRLSAQPQVNPEVEALKAEVAALKQGVTTIATREQEAVRTQFQQQVEAFASDPAHPYFTEVSEDIAKLLKAGAATSLEEAYDKAVNANPVTRQKEIDRLTAEATSTAQAQAQNRQDKKAKLTAVNVNAIPKSANGTVPVGTMDDTLEATLAMINARG